MERALVACSIGAVSCDPAARPATSAELVKLAEDALNAAKAAGAHRIEVRAHAG
jgi:GGDEF domain-containing protein